MLGCNLNVSATVSGFAKSAVHEFFFYYKEDHSSLSIGMITSLFFLASNFIGNQSIRIFYGA